MNWSVIHLIESEIMPRSVVDDNEFSSDVTWIQMSCDVRVQLYQNDASSHPLILYWTLANYRYETTTPENYKKYGRQWYY